MKKARKSTRPGIDVFPALSVLDQQTVMVRGDQYVPLKIREELPEPVLLVEDLVDIYGKVLVLDINGISMGEPQYDMIKEMCTKGDIWVDPGVDMADGIIDHVISGAAQVVEIFEQMRGKAGERQVSGMDIDLALTHNIGAHGTTAVVQIFERR